MPHQSPAIPTASPDEPPAVSAAAVDGADAAPEPTRRSRRAFVFFGALAAAATLPKRAHAQIRARRRSPEIRAPIDRFPTASTVESVAAFEEWDPAGVSRLIRRATMGITPAELAYASQLGWNGYLNYQLHYERIDDSAVEEVIEARWPLMSQTSDQLFNAVNAQVQRQLRESTLYRAAFSRRQLYQRMVELWSDHFNQDMGKVQYLLVADQRDVIRKHALGKFPDMLRASAHSASMLAYLDQNSSRKQAPNQNYAREIMELHTLGVDGGYTQTDVAELSRVFTGWTIQGRGNFVFNPSVHDWGAKTVMGVTIPAGAPSLGAAGVLEGETILDMLVAHPNTARFIATKMLKWLLAPEPSESQISTVAAVYRATDGDIKSMVRVILNDAWLPAAPMKLKRPFHFVASSLRSLNPTITDLAVVNNRLSSLGHVQFNWDTPDGYPDKMEYWAGNIVPKWSFAMALSTLNSTATVAVDVTPYRAGSTAAAIDLIDQNFFGGEMPSATRSALLSYIGTATLTEARTRELIALAISANAFQWY